MTISERYRSKAFACEQLANGAPSGALRCAGTEVAIEWHALAYRIAHAVGENSELEVA